MKKIKSYLFVLMSLLTIVSGMQSNTNATSNNSGPTYHMQYMHNPVDNYIYIFEAAIADGTIDELYAYEAIVYYNHLSPQGVITFVERGNIPSYVDDLIAVGKLPQGYIVGSGNGTTSTPPVEQTTPTTPLIPTTPADPTPSLDESKAGIYVVVNEAVKSYETYNKEAVVDTWVIGTQVDVKGLMSNGYYKVVKAEKEQYIDKGNLVPLDKYEAAWEETERVDSTCGKAGSVTYLNTISSETKTEALAPLEHDYKLIDQIAPTCTEKGLKTFECSACGDKKSEETLATGHTGLVCQSCEQIIILGKAMSPVVAITCGVASLGLLGVIAFFLSKKFR